MDLQYYFSGDFAKFEEYFSTIDHQIRKYKKKELLTGIGEPMDEMFYILSGTIASTYLHESGHYKAFPFYGKGYLVPFYFPGDLNILRSMAFTAVSDLEVYVFNRHTFDQYLYCNPELNKTMYRCYVDLVSQLMQDVASQLFCSGLEKISNFFYIYLENVKDKNNTIYLSQNEIMEFVGLNLKNVSKYLKILRDDEVIQTHRNMINVLDLEKLKKYCSLDLI
ncbi:MAG: Crp/Fnr family transcriptional regulator [Firmicutes bacterium]|nr:Crp/Fnr family transcriptional regulator [Bacillota bacterium]